MTMTERKEFEHRIKAKIALSLPLTAKERGLYLLYIASKEEVNEFLEEEQKNDIHISEKNGAII